MFTALQVLAALVVAITFSTTVGHALEFPGKRRLSEEQYRAVQPIYYPGYTFGGISEPVGILLLIALAVLTPAGTAAFWLTLGALVSFVGVHAAYWLFTHPVNNFWLAEAELAGASKRFFDVGKDRGLGRSDWTALRDRWEYSHVVRAALTFVALLLLVTAIAIG
jgi:Domain of unknown function (DUF1772)